MYELFVIPMFGVPWACAQQPVLSDPHPSASISAGPLADVQAMLDAGKFHEAEGALRVYLRDNDLSATAHGMLAYALLRENKPADSLKEYTRAASIEKPSASMLEHVGQQQSADRLRAALRATMNQDNLRTADLGGSASTRQFAAAVARRLQSGA